ncbi:MAG: DUF2202 domain-containing protein [Pyrinomonadaceae bacterium]
MKYLLTILTTSIVLFGACGNREGRNISDLTTGTTPAATQSPQTQQKENECNICDYDFAEYKGELNKEEVNALLLALNDEYLALATYERINKDFDNPRPFVNIREAESKHAEALSRLFTKYQIPLPENKWTGNVEGFESVSDACKAGVEAEIVNRDLYEKLLGSTKREDILTVFTQLKNASEYNHLPAFKRCADRQNGESRRGRS